MCNGHAHSVLTSTTEITQSAVLVANSNASALSLSRRPLEREENCEMNTSFVHQCDGNFWFLILLRAFLPLFIRACVHYFMCACMCLHACVFVCVFACVIPSRTCFVFARSLRCARHGKRDKMRLLLLKIAWNSPLPLFCMTRWFRLPTCIKVNAAGFAVIIS